MANDIIDKKVDERFSQIEGKLRNTFQAIRDDMTSIKEKLAVRDVVKAIPADSELRKDFEFLREKLGTKFSDVQDQIEQVSKIKQDNSELRALVKEISSLKDKIATKQDIESIKEELNDKVELAKKQLSKTGIKEEINTELTKNIADKFERITDNIQEFRSDISNKFSSYKSETEKQKKETIKALEKDKESILEDFNNQVEDLKKELGKKQKEFYSKLEEKDAQLKTMQSQISYLKGRVNSKLGKEVVEIEEDKEVEKQAKRKPINLPIGKILVSVVVLFLLCSAVYFIYSFAISSKQVAYFYDIGTEDDANHLYLSPLMRVSNIASMDNVTYRNITGALVYFDIPASKKMTSLNISLRFKDNFPLDSAMYVGVRNSSADFDYNEQEVYLKNSTNNSQNWTTVSAVFDAKNIYVSDNKITVLINIPHLSGTANQNVIPLDSINAIVKKSSLF